jgi:hypothetical protein
MSFNITLSKGDVVVKENKNTILVVRMTPSFARIAAPKTHLFWISIMHRTAFNYTYLYSNPEFLDRAESSLIIEFTKIYLSGALL